MAEQTKSGGTDPNSVRDAGLNLRFMRRRRVLERSGVRPLR